MKLETVFESLHAKNITSIMSDIIDTVYDRINSKMLPFDEDEDDLYMDNPSNYVEDFFDLFAPQLVLGLRSKLNIDVKFIDSDQSLAFVHRTYPNVMWLSSDLISKLKKRMVDNSLSFAKVKEKLLEVLVHEYTHILQNRKDTRPKFRMKSYFEHPAEIDAFVSGWYNMVNMKLGKKFDSKQFIQCMNDIFARFTLKDDGTHYVDFDGKKVVVKNVFDTISPSTRKKYIKKMYLALTTNHNENYTQKYKVNDEVSVYDIDKPYYKPILGVITKIADDNKYYVKMDHEYYDVIGDELIDEFQLSKPFKQNIQKHSTFNNSYPNMDNMDSYMSNDK